MNAAEIVFLFLFLSLNPLVIRKKPGAELHLWALCWCSILPYFGILMIAEWAPYEYPYERKSIVTLGVLTLVSLYAIIIYKLFGKSSRGDVDLSGRRGMFSPNQGGGPPNRFENTNIGIPSISKASLVISILAVCLLLLEFVINPAMRMSGDLLQNRDIFGQSTIVGTIGKVLSGAAILSLQTAWLRLLRFSEHVKINPKLTLLGELFRFYLHALPYKILASIYLLSGNRQFVFLGMVIMLLTAIYRKGFLVLFRPLSLFILIGVLCSGIMYQFFRNRDSAGQQDVFLRYVVNITEKSWNPLRDNYELNSSGMLLFTYYGIEYNVLTAMIDGKINYSTPLLGTLPIAYRRIQGPLGLRDQSELMLETGDALKGQLGSFGAVWSTMFGSFYIEYGMASLFFYSALIFVSLIVVARYADLFASREILVVGLGASLLFGIHYTITLDNFGVCYLAMLLTPGGLWLRRNQG